MKIGLKLMAAAAVASISVAPSFAATVNAVYQQGVNGYLGCSDAMLSHAGPDTLEPKVNFKDSSIYYMRDCLT